MTVEQGPSLLRLPVLATPPLALLSQQTRPFAHWLILRSGVLHPHSGQYSVLLIVSSEPSNQQTFYNLTASMVGIILRAVADFYLPLLDVLGAMICDYRMLIATSCQGLNNCLSFPFNKVFKPLLHGIFISSPSVGSLIPSLTSLWFSCLVPCC